MTYKNEGCDKYTSTEIQSWINRAEEILRINIEHNRNKDSAEFIQSLRQQLDDLRADLIVKKEEESQERTKEMLDRLERIHQSP